MDYKHGLSLFVQAEDYKRRQSLVSLVDWSMSRLAVLDVKKGQWWPGGLKKVKLYGVLFGLTVAFLITASYVLSGDKKRLLLIPSGERTTGLNLSFAKDLATLKQVVKNIVAKVEFNNRKVPDIKDLLGNEPHIFSAIPRKFLSTIKNPCWYEEHSGNSTVDPYGTNVYALYSRRFQAVYSYLRKTFQEHLYNQGDKRYRLRCLPYFYIMGQPKCGTTDLYDRLRHHPDVRFTAMKEPHWWTRKRFGEASASTMWDNNAWVYFYDNGTQEEPPFLVQDFIHAVQPHAKFIVMLRDPVERLYSDYLYFGLANKSAEDFHQRVSESLQLFESCVSASSMRSCVYNTTLNMAMPVRLQVGLYVIYILDWLTVFSKEQILVLRLEDHATNCKVTMHKVFDFLKLGALSVEKEAEITKSPASNTRRPADRNLGPMLPITRDLLKYFYHPFNQRLAKVVQDKAFLWT
ncbi:carbohydrate sulfotransferase 15-like isoform X2 [Denticeps clupeoides]|uniref:carbohydrate sulfotransferase 15-like isoform X2 n=1 Tax=Denticeps clupeoides TaxID=299321 RepID=UPI0010A350DE|nr:carbohydrate sulfotransferase 15-like isoform X2 [Denticeps clupeoides]